MNLRYRGLSYEYNPTQKTQQSLQSASLPERPYQLRYRGATYYVDTNTQLFEASVSQKTSKLIYRGLIYFSNRTAQKEIIIG